MSYDPKNTDAESDRVEAGCNDYEQTSDKDPDSYPDDSEASANNDKQYGGY